MQQAFDDIQADSSSRAVAILSRKMDNFLAGVDISLFTSLPPEELRKVTLEGQTFFNRIENFPKPVLAAVHGGCAGGAPSWCSPATTGWRPGVEATTSRCRGAAACCLAGRNQRLPRLVSCRRDLSWC